MNYKPPFPWFGGKRKVSKIVWSRLGIPESYIEPFFGSGAVLFGRPSAPRIETVNDLDHWIANFWRAVKANPDAVAEYADNPVNEDDLTARHIWLVKYAAPELAKRIPADPDYYDVKVAGWWVWGICSWIGGSWCAGNGPWTEQDGQIVNLSGTGQGVERRRIHLKGDGQGVLAKSRRDDLVTYFRQISDRLRNVRVCCGDWQRVVTRGALSHGDPVGVFLDPPYSMDIRDAKIYNHDCAGLAGEVLDWCIENGFNKRYRIALCGYEGEHNRLEEVGWSKVFWKANASYSHADSAGENKNRMLERIWFSPACVNRGLFDRVPV